MPKQETYFSNYERAKENIAHAKTLFLGPSNWNGAMEELLSYPQLSSLAFDVGALSWLEKGLSVLQQLSGLKEVSFYLARQNSEGFPFAVFQLPQLEAVQFSNFNARELPPEILDMPNLKTIRLDDMLHIGAEKVMDTIVQMPGLEELRLSFQKEEKAGEAPDNLLKRIGELKHLRSLFLGNAVGFAEEIGECRELETLEMWNVHRGRGEGMERPIPATWMQCTQLKTLWVRGSGVTALPENIGDLAALESLFLTRNSLSGLPDSICKLKNLRRFKAEHNSIAALPDNFGDLVNLEELSLSDNSLKELPKSFAQLTKLKSFFYLNDNPFETFPEPLTHLKQIGYLGINKTKISSIPASISNMESLYTLEIANSKLDHFPLEFLSMPSIYTLKLTGCPYARSAEGKLLVKNLKALLPYDHDETTLPQKLILYDLILGKFEKVKAEASVPELLALLDFGNKVTQNNILQLLEDMRPNPLAEAKPITKVLVCGKLNEFSKASVKKALAEAGLKGVTKLSDGPDLMVVGQKPGTLLSKGLEAGIPFMTGAQFNVWLQEGESGFLRDAGPEDTAIFDNFVSLFRAEDGDTKKLALELAQSGGLPSELVSEALVIAQIDPDAGNREAAQALFNKYASSGFQTHFSNHKRNAKAMSASKLEDYLEKLAEHPDANLKGMAQQAFRYNPQTRGLYIRLATVEELRSLIHKDGILYISGLRLKEIPENVFELRELKGISAVGNKLTTISDKIGQLTELEQLIIYKNPFVSLPESILQCAKLKVLQVQHCKLRSLPENIGQLTGLETLQAHDNKIAKLPKSMLKLQKLNYLHFGNNNFTSLPEEIFALPNLQQINFDNCKIKSIPELSPGPLKINRLELSNNQLSKLPDFFAGLHIESLTLVDNRFKELTDICAKIDGLRILRLRGNPMLQLPDSIADCRHLELISIVHPKGADGQVDWRQMADVLVKVPTLRNFSIFQHHLSEEDLAYVKAALPNAVF